MTFRVAVGLALVLGATAHAPAGSPSSFPCRWNYTFYVGLLAGKVTGGESADCAGIKGTLSLDASLFEWSPAQPHWRLARHVTRSWTNPSGNRFVEFTDHCSAGKAKAVFVWTLRAGSRIVARNRVATPPVADPGPACRLVLR